MRILIVDDDGEPAGPLSELLTREGFCVDMQPDGFKGLSAALGGCDLLVLDVMMPGMDGFEIPRRVRRELRLPALMLTENANFPEDGTDAEQLLAEADRRMYKGKRLRKKDRSSVVSMPLAEPFLGSNAEPPLHGAEAPEITAAAS